MKRRNVPRVLSVMACVGVVALMAALLPLAAPASAAPAAPQVTVYLKNFHAEYNIATTEFLAAQFDDLDSPAFGLVSYNIVTTALTAEALAGSKALVIDQSSDMSLSAAEALVINNFVTQGGRVGFFVFPRTFWDAEAPNPAAYQAIAGIWGVSAVGEPAAADLASGDSAAAVVEPEDNTLVIAGPYAMAAQSVQSVDQLPFSPITASGASPVLVSAALGGSPVAVANQRGIFVTNSIGDLVQGQDASPTYSQFVANAIVWLSGGAAPMPNKVFLPLMLR